MFPFPVADPIPLPAPVWLFKVLNIVTLGLHFVALQMLLGGLLGVIGLNFLARLQSNTLSDMRHQAAAALAKRLPIVMTYVINFGVPPLLFTQVLYGQALYTSSVLIGFWWMAVIALLTVCYWLLYKVADRTAAHQSAWTLALVAYGIAALIGRIYSANMTLMLRPEDWTQMYANSALGVYIPTNDPTTNPRWLFMLISGFAVSGLWMIWISATTSSFSQDLRAFFNRLGGQIAVVAIAAQLGLAMWVFAVQPDVVKTGLTTDTLYQIYGYAWLALTAGLLGIAAYSAFQKAQANLVVGWGAAAGVLLTMLAMVAYRDGIRDITLFSKGFDVWNRQIVTNWSVVGLFLALFVVGLGVVGWLISVAVRAKDNAPQVEDMTRETVSKTAIEGVNQ
ncbi:MAG: hypothetical protein HY22_03085 [[Candidatus Thermochlorobacteriaceae] bacterium GBChlB]|nr:MAG: hypothetical protein HY22_03085 [[Candidatus Thermochlorobacteriaceae] bacterium GBChlB]